ncbi:MAG: aldehyde dehydrogenase family protein [Acidimicrobiia bacterium]|nr:aldehyde dehydrogenase family protein [Acidimicrobiia bacterium]
MTTSTPDLKPVLIGGEWHRAASGATIDVTNPATGGRLAAIPRCGAAEIDRAVLAAETAFPAWSRMDAPARGRLLFLLADAIERIGEELATLDVVDNGSPLHEMRKDVMFATTHLRYFGGLSLQARGQTIPAGHERLNYSLRQPYGVVGRMVPFNHPLLFAAAKIAAPLVAGNTVVLKPSEHTSLSALRIAEEAHRLFPPGVINVVTGYGAEAGDALVAHPRVRRVAFIGAVETGMAIQRRAAEVAVKTVTLEMGGKNPLVVFPDADFDLALAGAQGGMNFTWQGQSCGSTSRLLVHRSIHRELVEQLAERLAALRPGPPLEPDSDTGSMVNRAQFDKVLRYVRLGQDEGATLVTGGTQVTGGDCGAGLFIRPALFDHVKPDSRLAQEEIFGPVLAVIPFDDYDEAVTIANGVRYGLTASVYTRDLATAHRFARDVQAGYVWVNQTSRHYEGTSFGGFKDSGIGREEDLDELLSYTQIKNVNVRLD